MSFTHKEPLQSKFAVMPAPKDIEALVRAEHPDRLRSSAPTTMSRAARLSAHSCLRP